MNVIYLGIDLAKNVFQLCGLNQTGKQVYKKRTDRKILEDAENGLSVRMRRTIAELYDLFNDLGRRISFFDKEIDAVFRQSEACQRIAKVKGIGPKTATAVVAAIGKGTEFKNGRHFSAWLGLVPRQHSSGDRQVLMNMTKKGDKHLRTLFIHGARAVVRVATNNNEGYIKSMG